MKTLIFKKLFADVQFLDDISSKNYKSFLNNCKKKIYKIKAYKLFLS